MEHPSLLGIYFLFYSSFLAKKFIAIHPEFPNLDLTSIETERFLITFGLYFLASIFLMIIGNSLYIPQYYAYSQVEISPLWHPRFRTSQTRTNP